MRSACRITRPGVGNVWNKVTLQYDSAPRVVIYDGKCKVKRSNSLQERTADVAGQRYTEQSSTLALPLGASGEVQKDDEVEVTASKTDASLVGARYRVVARVGADDATSRRFTIEDSQ